MSDTTLETYIAEARAENRVITETRIQLASEAAEKRRIARSNIFARAWYAVRQWWRDLNLLGWPASRTPWYKVPGGFNAFGSSMQEPHPHAVGYFERKRMIESDPLVIPGDETRVESDARDDSTWQD